MSITHITPTEQAQGAALTDAHYELCAYSLRMDNDEATMARLRGRLEVCTDIMSSAAAVLATIEPESAAESEALDALLEQIKTACLAIWTDPAPGAAIANATGDDDAAPECTCAAKDMTFGRCCKVTPNTEGKPTREAGSA